MCASRVLDGDGDEDKGARLEATANNSFQLRSGLSSWLSDGVQRVYSRCGSSAANLSLVGRAQGLVIPSPATGNAN